MTEEAMYKANRNRNEREQLLKDYNYVSHLYDTTSDNDDVILNINCNPNKKIFPTVKEYRNLLRNMRDRLDMEISKLDKEFAEL